MKRKKKLNSLKKFLSEDISPKQLAEVLDELLYDYSRINLHIRHLKDDKHMYVHPEATEFLYWIKSLRDILKAP
jgi:chromosome segregation and condensation protein ScpB